MKNVLVGIGMFLALGLCAHHRSQMVGNSFPTTLSRSDTDWPSYGGDKGGSRYSRLDQINTRNVKGLKVAWTYHAGGADDSTRTSIECNPIVIAGTMYVTSPAGLVIALNPETGRELWRFNPHEAGRRTNYIAEAPMGHGARGLSRGLAYWSDGTPNGNKRIMLGTTDGRLLSVDAKSGQPDLAFGKRGEVNLRDGLEREIDSFYYGVTSPPGIYEDLAIIGFSVGEGPGSVAPGDVRAFNVRTGKEVWRFHTVPQRGEFGHDTWKNESWKDRGGANAWGGVSIDAKAGMAFVGLGSATFDYYGGDRQGQNLFANSIVALNARTGQRLWHFQTVRHDLWDMDLAAFPNLVTVNRNGKTVEAVAQVTKTGYVYLFERRTGEPLFDLVERSTPRSDVPGEATWPTQIFPVKPPPFSRQSFAEQDVTDISREAHEYVLAKLKNLRFGPIFTPPSVQGSIYLPGLHGGATWSGASFDPSTSILYVNSNNIPWLITLVKASREASYPYNVKVARFTDQEGHPAIKPPWGNLTAIDLNRGEFVWQVPLGEFPELTARGIPPTGTENFGGSVVTAGGLIFIASTMDERFRAFDKNTGKVLWEHQLDAGGYALPCTYSINGRQFVVIAAGGGGKLETRSGDAFVAFSLPK